MTTPSRRQYVRYRCRRYCKLFGHDTADGEQCRRCGAIVPENHD